MGNSTGNAVKKNYENRQKSENKGKTLKHVCWNKKKEATQEKITIQLDETNQNVLEKEERFKRYPQRLKQYRQCRTFQNNEGRFY